MTDATYDVAVIGGGAVGMATAMHLCSQGQMKVVVLEAEDHLAAHQTGHNSGVIHSGLYYRPGSLKARNCVGGRKALIHFCQERSVPFELCGKIVVTTRPDEQPMLEELARRGEANGLRGLRMLSMGEIAEREPNIKALSGLLVPGTGIVDFSRVTQAYAEAFRETGGEIRLQSALRACLKDGDALVLETPQGAVRARYLINCCGLQSDRVARMCGVDPGVRIVPFRGEYYTLQAERRSLIRHLVYPVPDPRFPFLGVHFTRMIGGGVEAGPNAVLAFCREGYRKRDISARDLWDVLAYPGFWRMAMPFWKTGFGEFHRSFSKGAFVKALQRLLPGIEPGDLSPGGSGVRAQAVSGEGKLLDDFHIVEAERMLHVLNAPSPAATASMSIGRTLAERACSHFDLPGMAV